MRGLVMHRWSQPPEEIWPDYFADDSPSTRSKRFFRRAKLLAVQAGAPAVWKEKLVKRLEQRNAA